MGFLPHHDASTIIDRCNGLLLYYASRPAAFHVVNPTTRRRAALPAPRARALLSVLSFDPAPPRATRCSASRGGCPPDAGHCRGRQRFASSVGTRLRIWELEDAGASESALKHKIEIGDGVPAAGNR
ncbi:F-box protein [Panicum miliaceum]|uniref:F-box protein n=1 Tax=Panicum miliaceum TaxID=4540 RepID=A0A3L6SHN2_PANMI|nr:F-box protein [Panicum miliaceum]